MGFLKWLQAGPVRVKRARRHQQPDMSSYYWDGGAPAARDVKDISASGAFLYTANAEELYPGTIVTVVLQRPRTQESSADPLDSVTVSCKVSRRTSDGVGVRFVFEKAEERKSLERFLKRSLNTGAGRIVKLAKDTEGQALVEFALMTPLLFLLIVNMVNFGGFFFAWITVSNAARAGAQYAVLNSGSVGSLSPATATQITSLITQDISSLLNRASLTINVCQNNNGTVTAVSGTCSGISADPEPATFLLTSVDVTYTYNPLIPLFSFPSLGIRATLPPTTIHRRTYMRVIQ
jgi:Flp pilus assembly protein TadG